MRLLSIGLDMATNYWLSDWSNEATDIAKAQSNKYFRLGIYAVFGLSKCNLILSKSINK